MLALTDDEPLFVRLREYNRTGRPPYPVEAMWRAFLTKYLLGIRYNVELVALLRSNPRVRQICGFGESVPNESIVCRFFKRLTNHQDLVDQAIERLVDRLAAAVDVQKDATAPPVGTIVAIDSTDIEACVDTEKKPYSDPDADWGVGTNTKAKGGKEKFYGYKMHALCDAYYGIPLGHIILPANKNDSPQLPKLFKMSRSAHPGLRMRYALADRGYDALINYRYLDERDIIPVIHIRNTDKNGIYTVEGRPKCLGGKAMDYIGTDPEQGHLFRCSVGGCHLKNKVHFTRYCDSAHYEQPTGDLLRRVGRLPRTSRLWRRLYRKRPVIERLFSSMKRSRLLNKHRCRGLRKIRLHAALSTLTYLGTMLMRVQASDMSRMRRMRIRMPVVNQPLIPLGQLALAA